MLKKIVYRLLRHRHFWRDVGFDELSELYTSAMLRNFALNLVGIFIPFYFYQLGHSVSAIMAFYGVYFTSRVVLDVISGYIVARIGPKHVIAISYFLQIAGLAMLSTLSNISWPLWSIAVMSASGTSMFYIAYHVDFSKIKHAKHGGSEIGYMLIMDKIGAMLGPVAGGIVATVFGPQYAFVVATVFFTIALVPLFLTSEPVKTHQHLNFKDLPIDTMKRDLVSYAFMGVENTVCLAIWPLFMALFVVNHDKVYSSVGVISSLAVVASLISAHAIGKYIDAKEGHRLLRISVLINTMLHITRPFVSTFFGALTLNVANEVVTTGYRMPFHKGMYGAADDLPGFRIAYVVTMEAAENYTQAWMYWILAILAGFINTKTVLSGAFIFGAVASMLILTERFVALRGRERHAV